MLDTNAGGAVAPRRLGPVPHPVSRGIFSRTTYARSCTRRSRRRALSESMLSPTPESVVECTSNSTPDSTLGNTSQLMHESIRDSTLQSAPKTTLAYAPKPMRSICLDQMPTEIVINIMSNMRPRELFFFIKTSRRYETIMEQNKPTIYFDILQRCPELKTLLNIFTAQQKEIVPGYMLYPRVIWFNLTKANVEKNRVLAHADLMKSYPRGVELDPLIVRERVSAVAPPYDPNPEQLAKDKIFLVRAPVAWVDKKLLCPIKFELSMASLETLFHLIDVIDWWVEHYPQLRWRDDAQERRCLWPEEEARLRKAIAHWWLYSIFFHGRFRRSTYVPKLYDDHDTRLNLLRTLSTEELSELSDLWNTIYDCVSLDICASPDRVENKNANGGYDIDLQLWGKSEAEHCVMVRTVMKLSPKQMKDLLENNYRNARRNILRVINRDLSITGRGLAFDTESLTLSIGTVLDERIDLLYKCDVSRPLPCMPIVSIDRSDQPDRDVFRQDAWPGGKAPGAAEKLALLGLQLTERIRPGNDGWGQG
ncbi:hypothetical protein F5Y18DRAFT_106805 [Xylariaceae sp. FL1019]|nr:hypothetical protein F5Y18DRAFT_106805 [Xylariaceae sp. FL1019]